MPNGIKNTTPHKVYSAADSMSIAETDMYVLETELETKRSRRREIHSFTVIATVASKFKAIESA